MVLATRRFGEQIRNTLKVFKCGAGKGWIISIKEVQHRVKNERNVLRRVGRRKVNWIGHILCNNFLLNHVVEGKVEGSRR